ncbi:hypothetical protein HNR74_001292 [Flammeovirga kamogawensis]|nr:hypothetical protein [Flammeovirga kamogawensis]
MHYIAFRFYTFILKYQKFKQPESTNRFKIATIPLSFTIIINLITVKFLLIKFNFKIPIITNELILISIMLAIIIIVHFTISKRKNFLSKYRKNMIGDFLSCYI